MFKARHPNPNKTNIKSDSHPLPSFAFPTRYSKEPITEGRIRRFEELLAAPANHPVLSDLTGRFNDICDIFKTIQEPQAQRAALRFLDLYAELVPKAESRVNDLPKQTHGLSYAYVGLMGGAPADWACGYMLHDCVEEGLIKDLNDLKTKLALPSDETTERFISIVWSYMNGATNREPQESLDDFNHLKKMFKEVAIKEGSPQVGDYLTLLKNPEVKRIMDKRLNAYRHYILHQVYGSQNLLLINLKEFDVLHNIKTLDVDPLQNFYLYYMTLRKALIHIEYGKKVNYRMARATLEAMGQALHRLEKSGFGAPQLGELFTSYDYHRDHRSRIQRKFERRGLDVMDPRYEYDPHSASYSCSPVIEFYRPREQDFFMLLGSADQDWLWEFGAPSKTRVEYHWNFLNNTFQEVPYEKLVKRINRYLGPSYHVTQKPTLQLPCFGDEFYIFEIKTPQKLKDLYEDYAGLSDPEKREQIYQKYSDLPANETEAALVLYEKARAIYCDYTEDLKRQLLRIGRGTIFNNPWKKFRDWVQEKTERYNRIESEKWDSSDPYS